MTSVSVFSGRLACDKRERWRTGANATAIRPLSFRGDAKHRTTMRNCASENLEIPRCAIAHPGFGPSAHPGMTESSDCCRGSLSSGAHSRDPLARNDEDGAYVWLRRACLNICACEAAEIEISAVLLRSNELLRSNSIHTADVIARFPPTKHGEKACNKSGDRKCPSFLPSHRR